MERDTIAILDFGSQYTQLIARRFRELQVYSEILPPRTSAAALRARGVRGIVLSGGPDSVYAKGAPRCERAVFEAGVPVLGICYGMHLMSHLLGGEVKAVGSKEFGPAELQVKPGSRLLDGVAPRTPVWMSHGDSSARTPPGFRVIASTANTATAAIEDSDRKLYGIQFHPEVRHTREGMTVLANFLDASGCRRDWNATSFIEESVRRIRETVGEGRVLCALSGGVDSAVAALLVHRAIGDRLVCVFVDNGLLRKDEATQVRKRFADKLKLKVVFVDATRRFLSALRGVTDPERKRKIIGREFITVFQQAARKMKGFGFLAQGTLYPDVIESTSVRGPSAVIKSHHNVGGLPKKLGFKLVEPLRELFKDEVRAVGLQLGLDEEFVHRQPFPGPGPGGALPGPDHAGEAGHPARGGRRRGPGDQGRGALPAGLAVVRGAAPGAIGGRDGRRPDVPVGDRDPGRGVGGRHDRGLGAAALRPARPHLQRHRQRGPGHQPRGVRHLQQAAVHDRVGVNGRADLGAHGAD